MVTEAEAWSAICGLRAGAGASPERLEEQPFLMALLGAATGDEGVEMLTDYFRTAAKRDPDARALRVALGLEAGLPGTLAGRRKTLKIATSTLKGRERRAGRDLYAHFTRLLKSGTRFAAHGLHPPVVADVITPTLKVVLAWVPLEGMNDQAAAGVSIVTSHAARQDSLHVSYVDHPSYSDQLMCLTFRVTSLPSYEIEVLLPVADRLVIVRRWLDGRRPKTAEALWVEADGWRQRLELRDDARTNDQSFGIESPPVDGELALTWTYRDGR